VSLAGGCPSQPSPQFYVNLSAAAPAVVAETLQKGSDHDTQSPRSVSTAEDSHTTYTNGLDSARTHGTQEGGDEAHNACDFPPPPDDTCWTSAGAGIVSQDTWGTADIDIEVRCGEVEAVEGRSQVEAVEGRAEALVVEAPSKEQLAEAVESRSIMMRNPRMLVGILLPGLLAVTCCLARRR
jgi:hypothetical protein